MKSIWNGFISFGLVNIPIKLYSAIESKSTKMRLLHKKKLSPIRLKRWCDDCDEEVPWEDIVRGVEVGKNRYVVLEPNELKSIKAEKSQSVEVVQFTDSSNLDPLYFNTHYYAGPEREREKTYFLFKETLQRSGKIAIGRFVMREKEHLCAIMSYKDGLLLTTLNYADEIRPIGDIKEIKQKPKISNVEFELAQQLISRIYKRDFHLNEFKDTYEEELKKVINKKLHGEIISVEKTKVPETNDKNLIEALKASLR